MCKHAPISLVASANPCAVGRGAEGLTVIAEGEHVAYVNGTRCVTHRAVHLHLDPQQVAALQLGLEKSGRRLKPVLPRQKRLPEEERGDGDVA